MPASVSALRRLPRILAVAGVLLLAGCGDDDSADTASTSAAGNQTDRAFVADMVPHHEAAVQMAQIAGERGKSAFVKNLAANIIKTQRAEIATMRREDAGLAKAGVKAGTLGLDAAAMGMDHDTAMLATAKDFDRAFLEMMVPHHEGALEMSKIELRKGADPELKELAQQITAGQTREIAQMREHLKGKPGSDEDAMRGDEDEMHEDNHEAAPGY
jgi:uncharacterized protein (DUF305 family)